MQIRSQWVQHFQLSQLSLHLYGSDFRYDIERPHATVYDVDLDVSLCWEGVCGEPVVILQDAMFSSGSHCDDPTTGSSSRRRRRSVDDL